MIIDEITFPSNEQGETIYGRIYYPYCEPRGIVQFTHGMCDYGARYEDLFREITDFGYVAAYCDDLGHGHTLQSLDDLGYFSARKGYLKLADDFCTFYDLLDEKFPDTKHYIMGHSMGSFLVRYFMSSYRKNMAGAILMGTGGPNPFAGVGSLLAAGIGLVRGGYYRSSFLNNLVFGTYNKHIENPESDWDWLSYDRNTVNSFLEDEYRNRTFTASGFKDMLTLYRLANSVTLIDDIPRELPILFLSGEDDPLGDYGNGIKKLGHIFDSKDFKDVEINILPEARHELCHELCKRQVFADIGDWLGRHFYEDVHLSYPEDPEEEYTEESEEDEEYSPEEMKESSRFF